jgi:DNA-binding transcriptional LysR family regulator
MMNLDDLSDFVLVAAHGGFAKASRASGRPKATLSRKVIELEASLGVRLFERGARSVRLTEEGELLFTRTAGLLSDIAESADIVRDVGARPRGRLRVNVPTLFGHLLMGRLAAQFTAAYPDVTLTVTTEDRAVDLVREGYDAVIRVNPKPDSALVGRCFVRDQLLIVAAPGFTDQVPVPVVVRNSTKSPAIWPIAGDSTRDIHTRPVLALPTLTMMRDAVLTGIGAAKLPRLLVADDLAAGRLVCWGPSTDPSTELWVLHPSTRHASARVKVFMRFLKDAFPGEWL